MNIRTFLVMVWFLSAVFTRASHPVKDNTGVLRHPPRWFSRRKLLSEGKDHQVPPLALNNKGAFYLSYDGKEERLQVDHRKNQFNYWCRIDEEGDRTPDATGIELSHQLFDATAGIVPGMVYDVLFPFEEKAEFVYKLTVSKGRLLAIEDDGVTLSTVCDTGGPDPDRLLVFNSVTNVTWIVDATPTNVIPVKLTLVVYDANSNEIVSKSEIVHQILPGCYLKIRPTHGVISSWHLFPEDHPSSNVPRAKWTDQERIALTTCTMLLAVPSPVHSADFSLRKLKLPRWHQECLHDNVIQMGTLDKTIDFSVAHWFEALQAVDGQWNVMRNYCGKVHDYARNERWWRASGARTVFIRIRNRNHRSSFFSFKFSTVDPCSNGVFTQRHATLELPSHKLEAAIHRNECTFQVHLNYGYRVNLWAHLRLTGQDDDPSEKNLPNSKEQDADNIAYGSLSEAKGACQMIVQIEDAAGKHSSCMSLSERQSTTSFTSLTNTLHFHAILISDDSQDSKRFDSAAHQTNVSHHKTIAEESSEIPTRKMVLKVYYTAVQVPNLTDGCDTDWVAADDASCISIHDDILLGWHEAESQCGRFGGNLAYVTSASIQEAIDAAITNSPRYDLTRSYWIGGSHHKLGTHFVWNNGKPITYSKWFPGWSTLRGYNAKPSGDGFSNQDCIEIRQNFGKLGQSGSLASGMFWNDRDCSVPNSFVCQKPRNSGVVTIANSIECNRTEELSRSRPSVIIQSPRYPLSYPESVFCKTHLVAPAGYSILLNFDAFNLEDEEDCNYDFVELREASEEQSGNSHKPLLWRKCGNWNSRLKLLRWRSSSNHVDIVFVSDTSYISQGFQVSATIEKTHLNCPGNNSLSYRDYCYLIVPYPEIGWVAARDHCLSIQADLALLDTAEEFHFIANEFRINDHLNSNFFYWIGQVDRFQLSVLHSVTDSIHHCPALRTGFQHKNTSLEPCLSPGGYICKKINKIDNSGMMRNSTIESREGEVKSPNFPMPYANNNDFRLHIKAKANGSAESERLSIHFHHFDLEYQENCLYDYVALQGAENGPITYLCGHHNDDLSTLDYISETSEVWLSFHSDNSLVGSGFHATWSTVRLNGCPYQVINEPPSGVVQSPNFPHYYLPHMNCTYLLTAPDNMRVSIKFHVLEMVENVPTVGKQLARNACVHEYVRVTVREEAVSLCDLHNATTAATKGGLQYLSDGNRLSLQLVSQAGKQGRGFQASYRFEPIPTTLYDVLNVGVDGDEIEIIPLNYPMKTPLNVTHQLSLVTHHGYHIRFESRKLQLCKQSSGVVNMRAELRDVFNSEMLLDLCTDSTRSNFSYESVFHTFTLTYQQINRQPAFILGTVRAVKDNNYIRRVSNFPDHAAVPACNLKPCLNGGVCKSNKSIDYCQCRGKWRGLFCSLTLCQLSKCVHGSCSSVNDTQICICDTGFTGDLCDTPMTACDSNPCHGRGSCINTETGFHCQCHAWWQGVQCETRWLQIPYKPLSQRMLEEPFWLGLITIAVVLVAIGLVWCIKRYFAEKIERFVTEELERGKLDGDGSPNGDWRRLRTSRSSLEPILSQAGLHNFSRSNSPQPNHLNIPNSDGTSHRNFLGFRKSSLLSITSLLNPCQISVPSPDRRDTGRTFSLDDLFRTSSVRRSPSPGRKLSSENELSSAQRRDTERQQILQRLVGTHVRRPSKLTAESVLLTSLTTEGRAFIGRHPATADEQSTDTDTMAETVLEMSANSQLDLKAEKRVTFARMLDLVSMARLSSSETDNSTGEDVLSNRSAPRDSRMANKGEHRSQPRRKNRSWSSRRMWRTTTTKTSAQGSASDHDFESIAGNATSLIQTHEPNKNKPNNQHGPGRVLRLPNQSPSDRQSSSSESLLTVLRHLSVGTHKPPSTPSSPQISDYDLSSSYPTPISTPGTPCGSLEALQCSGLSENPHSIQVSVIDPMVAARSTRSNGSSLNTPHITLEIPTPSFGSFLSPIHEVPSPLPSPLPSLRRQSAVPSTESSFVSPQGGSQGAKIPIPSVIIVSDDGVASDYLQPVDSDSPLPPTPQSARSKPPPLNIINSNFARFEKLGDFSSRYKVDAVTVPAMPILCISIPSPEESVKSIHTRSTSENRKIGSPPSRKSQELGEDVISINNSAVRRVLKDSGEKCSSLDLPAAPPMITITANFSECESDFDIGPSGVGGMVGPKKMCYLSPFACYGTHPPDIGASESNLSSSGYSSMASPGPSPSSSSKTLCVLENEDVSRVLRRGARDRPTLHRMLSPSFESNSPPLDSLHVGQELPLTCAKIAAILQETDSDATDDQLKNEPSALESTIDSHDEGIGIDHAGERTGLSEMKNVNEMDHFGMVDTKNPDSKVIDLKLLSVQSCKVQKSRSLDSKLKGERQTKLKSDSLDTKMLTLQPAEGVFKFNLQSLQIPDSASTSSQCAQQRLDSSTSDEMKKRGSPMSSRSESPLSDVRSAGLGRFSTHFYGMSRPDLPFTDSDGLYDYPSSEAVLPVTDVSRRCYKRCDRRRERKVSLQLGHTEMDGGASPRELPSLLRPEAHRDAHRGQSGGKRRIRAQSHVYSNATSSSNESLSTDQRPPLRRTSVSHRAKLTADWAARRASTESPVCGVILTIQAASSAESVSEDTTVFNKSRLPGPLRIESRKTKSPTRLRTTGRQLSLRQWKKPEAGGKRRDTAAAKNRQKVELDLTVDQRDSFSSCMSDSDANGSNDSLANLAELEDSTDSQSEITMEGKS